MSSELADIFEQGDADLFGTAGQPATLHRVQRPGLPAQHLPLTVLIAPAEVAWELTTPAGYTVTCDTVATLRRVECVQRPSPGDRLTLEDGSVYEFVRVTGWTHGTTWHADLTLRHEAVGNS